MEIEKLADIIPNYNGRTFGELFHELIQKGYDENHASKIIDKFIADSPSSNPTHSTWMDEYTGPNPKFFK